MKKFYLGILSSFILVPAITLAGFFDWFNFLEPKPDNSIVNFEMELEDEILIKDDLAIEEGDLTLSSSIFTSPVFGSKNIRGKMPVTFMWSESIFSLENPDAVAKKLPELITISPEIEGSFQLIGTTGILFEPQNDWNLSTRYMFEFSAEFLEMVKLEAWDYWFETPRLKLDNVVARNLNKREPLILNFSQKVDLELLSGLVIHPGLEFDLEAVEDDKKIALHNFFLLETESETIDAELSPKKFRKSVQLIPRTDWKENQRYKIVLPAGVKSAEGELETLEEQSKTFMSIKPFSISYFGHPHNVFSDLNLNFSAGISLEQFFENVEILADGKSILEADYLKKIKAPYINLAGKYKEDSYRYVRIPAPQKYWNPEVEYTFVLNDKLQDVYGRELGEIYESRFSAEFPNRFSEIFLLPNNAVIERSTDFESKFWYSGEVESVKVELKMNLLRDIEASKTYQLPKSLDKESFFTFNLREDFPQFFDEHGNFFPGGYVLKIETKSNNENYWGDHFQRNFFVADFGVGVKKTADKQQHLTFNDFITGKELSEKFTAVFYENHYQAGWKGTKTFGYINKPGGDLENFGLASGEVIDFDSKNSWIVVAHNGEKFGIGGGLFRDGLKYEGSESSFYSRNDIRNFGFLDRPLYKPGDTVYFKDVFRKLSPFGDDFFLEKFETLEDFQVVIRDEKWTEVANFVVTDVNETWGSFDGSWKIPVDVRLGNYMMHITGNGISERLKFYIGNYRKSNFLVNADFEVDRLIYGEDITAEISAEYVFGGGFSNKSFDYKLVLKGSKPMLYPWVGYRKGGFGDCFDCGFKAGSEEIILKSGQGLLDEKGKFEVVLSGNDFKEKLAEKLKDERILDNADFENINWNQLVLSTTVRDGKTEEVSANSTINYFENFYKFELDAGNYFYEAGKFSEFSGKVVDLDGTRIDGLSVTGTLQKHFWNDEISDMDRVDLATKTFKTNDHGVFGWEVMIPQDGGQYSVVFEAKSDGGMDNFSAEKSFWVSGLDNKSVQKEFVSRDLLMIANQPVYQVGETAEIFMVNSDLKIEFAKISLERGEVFSELEFDEKNSLVRFKVEDWMVPNIFVSGFLSGTNAKNQGDIRYGILEIPVENSLRKLDFSIVPDQEIYKPGATVTLDIISSAKGNRVPAELTVMVVDKSLLSLKGMGNLDLFDRFFTKIPFGNHFTHGLANFISPADFEFLAQKSAEILLSNAEEDFAEPEMLTSSLSFSRSIKGSGKIMQKSMNFAEGAIMEDLAESDSAAVADGGTDVRSEFSDLAVFNGSIITNEQGEGTLTFTLPDNLTTWEIMVVGHAQDQRFGNSSTEIRTQLPLMVSEIVPQFFRMGDTLKIGAFIKVNNDSPQSYKVNLVNVSGIEVLGDVEKLIEIEDEARVYFDVTVPINFEGEDKLANFVINVKALDDELLSNKSDQKLIDKNKLHLADAVEITRKIYAPKVSLTAADFFRVEDLKRINLNIDYMRSLKSQVVVKTFLSLVDRIESFVDVTKQTNYGCAEQQFSYGTSLLMQRQLNRTIGRVNPKINRELFEAVQAFIGEAFVSGGGFSFWKKEQKSNVWVTTQILEFADLWAVAGFAFDESMLRDSADYLNREILKVCDVENNWRCLSDATRQNAAYVLAKRGVLSADSFGKLENHLNSLEAKIWWLSSSQILTKSRKLTLSTEQATLVSDIWKEIDALMKIRDRYVHWEESSKYRSFYSQHERITALILERLIWEKRLTEIHPKVVRYLTDMDNKYLSGNTALRVMATLGLYAELNEVDSVGSEVIVTLNSRGNLIESTLENLSAYVEAAHDFDLSLEDELSAENSDLNLQVMDDFVEFKTENEKSFYGEITLKEVFKVEDLSPIHKGFWLDRKIYKLADTEFENPIEKLVQGENYVVRLKIVSNISHRQVMLEDGGIGGAEFVNFDFDNVNQDLEKYVLKKSPNFGIMRCYGWCRPSFVHQEFYDEKVRFFADYLPAGTFEVTYVIKARLTGKFDWVPAKIEEMYYPEVFGLTKGESIIIE